MQISSKQISKFMLAAIGIAGFTTAAALSDNVTAALTTAVTTAGSGDNGGSTAVPLQAGSVTTEGFAVVTSNYVPIFLNGPQKTRALDAAGNEIYGKLTLAGAVYTLSYFSAPGGVEGAYTWAIATVVDMELPYWFTFGDLPHDAIINVRERHVNDVLSSTGTPFLETLLVTALNTVAATTKVPKTSQPIQWFVNGQTFKSGEGFTLAGSATTVVPATLGFNVATTDTVDISYYY